jgi:hypothetical protein
MTSTTDPQLVTAAEVAVHAWAATHTDPGPIFTDPDVPPDGGHPPQIWAVMNQAAHEAQELNHPWIGEDHTPSATIPAGGRREPIALPRRPRHRLCLRSVG